VVRHARLEASGKRALTLRLATQGRADLELWGLDNRRAAMERAMRRRLNIVVEASGAAEAGE
jgi:hypothetical protein